MKSLSLFLLVSLVPACGQQLVQFRDVDLASVAPNDFAPAKDLAVNPGSDLSMISGDMHSQVPDLALDDLLNVNDGSLRSNPLAACAAMLGSAAKKYAVLGGSTVTSTGPTILVGGNIGVSPGTMFTDGPPAAVLINGSIDEADAPAAQVDVTNVYTCSQSAICNTVLTGTDLSGLTIGPGVYFFASSAELTLDGDLVLDAHGDPNAIWFFQVGSTLTLGSNARMFVINGGQDCKVFWQVTSSVTLGSGSRLVGNMVTLASIVIETGATVSGRALARSGAVTMDSNAITVPACK